jgi:uncharacterized protein
MPFLLQFLRSRPGRCGCDGTLSPFPSIIGQQRVRLGSLTPSIQIRRWELTYRVDRLWSGLVLMYGAGLLSALLGIGSGVLKIPAMDAALRLPIKVSSATSTFMIGVTAAASAGAYFMRGVIVPEIAGRVALGSIIGAALGARLLLFIPPSKLRLIFVAVLLVLAIEMILAALGVHREPGG